MKRELFEILNRSVTDMETIEDDSDTMNFAERLSWGDGDEAEISPRRPAKKPLMGLTRSCVHGYQRRARARAFVGLDD